MFDLEKGVKNSRKHKRVDLEKEVKNSRKHKRFRKNLHF